jgi:hypothetical protein
MTMPTFSLTKDDHILDTMRESKSIRKCKITRELQEILQSLAFNCYQKEHFFNTP